MMDAIASNHLELQARYAALEARLVQVKDAANQAMRNLQEEAEVQRKAVERAEGKATRLQELLAAEVEQRNAEAAHVEEKARRVKDWVSKKIGEMEQRATSDGLQVVVATERALKTEQALAAANEQLKVWEKRTRAAEMRMHQLEDQLSELSQPPRRRSMLPSADVALKMAAVIEGRPIFATGSAPMIVPTEPATDEMPVGTQPQPQVTEVAQYQPNTVVKTVSRVKDQHGQQEVTEYQGYLYKQGEKVKAWKKRFFVLQSRRLYYYKSAEDFASGELLGCISLSGLRSVALTDISDNKRPFTFEIQTAHRSYALSASSQAEAKEWMQIIQNVMRRSSDIFIRGINDPMDSTAVQGWLIKHKRGFSVSRWFVLQKNMLVYYRSPTDKTALGSISLQDVHAVEVIDAADQSDAEEATLEQDDHAFFALHMRPGAPGPSRGSNDDNGAQNNGTRTHAPDSYYFEALSRQEMEKWVTINEDSDYGTETERLLRDMGVRSAAPLDSTPFYQNHPVLTFQKDALSSPLTTLSSDRLCSDAIELFKAVQMYSGTVIDQKGIDYHVALAQSIVRKGIAEPELRNELYLQLIKQTINHPYPNSALTIQCWHLIALICGVFLPTRLVLPYLKIHLQRNAERENTVAIYSRYAQQALEAVLRVAERTSVPSRLEVSSIMLIQDLMSLRATAPFRVDVSIITGETVEVSFGVADTIKDVQNMIMNHLHLEPQTTHPSDYGLFMSHPQRPSCEIYLLPQERLVNALSYFDEEKKILRPANDPNAAKMGPIVTLQDDIRRQTTALNLTFKIWVLSLDTAMPTTTNIISAVDFHAMGPTDAWYRRASTSERKLLFAQANHEVVQGYIPLSEDAAVSLAALQAQVEWGDHLPLAEPMDQHKLIVVFDRFFPIKDKPTTTANIQRMCSLVSNKWSQLRHRSEIECINVYFSHVCSWSLFCSAWVEAVQQLSDKLPSKILLAVRYSGLYVVDPKTLAIYAAYNFKQLSTFGNTSDNTFSIIVDKKPLGGAQKITFRLDWGAAQVTQRLSAYINAIMRNLGTDSYAARIQQSNVLDERTAASGNSKGDHVVSRVDFYSHAS